MAGAATFFWSALASICCDCSKAWGSSALTDAVPHAFCADIRASALVSSCFEEEAAFYIGVRPAQQRNRYFNIMNCQHHELSSNKRSARRLPACGYVLTETGTSCRADSTVSAAVAVVGVLRALMMESLSRTTWPAQPGRLVGSGSRLASSLRALQRGMPGLSRTPLISFLSSLPCGAGCRVRISRILWPVLLLVALSAGSSLLLLLHIACWNQQLSRSSTPDSDSAASPSCF